MIIDPNPLGQPAIATMLLFKRLPLGMSVGYIAKGPVRSNLQLIDPDYWESFCAAVDPICIREKAVFLRVEPDEWETPTDMTSVSTDFQVSVPPGFVLSKEAIQPKQTLIVDLRGDEDDVLRRMKQKTRYNIRLAIKKGVSVHPSDDIKAFYGLLEKTRDRDLFGIHLLEYYQRVFDLFSRRGQCRLLMAEYDGILLAGLMVFARGKNAWYFYGASGDERRELMPTYLLQWEAIRWARQQGCESYDLWGIPDVPENELEQSFTRRQDGLWSVYRFKRGFGGEIRRSTGPWDRVYKPAMYRLYHWLRKIRSGNQHGD